MKLFDNDFEFINSLIRRITICFFIGILAELFHVVMNSGQNNIGILVAIFIAIITLELKLMYEMGN